MAKIVDRIKGHEKNIKHLNASLSSESLAPAYLFVGLPGIGKQLVAKHMAQSLACETANIACGQCGSCIRIEKGQSEALLEIKPQSSMIKIESAQKIIQFLSLRSLSRGRTVIIHDAHKMNQQTANALLKSVEEPPENSHFIFVTSQVGMILPTIRSRSQQVHFSPLSIDELKAIAPKAPEWALYSSQGRMDIVQQLLNEGESHQRSDFINMFFSVMHPQGNINSMKDWLGDKENTQKLLETWQQLTRDLLFVKKNLQPLIHRDQVEQFQNYRSLDEQNLNGFFWGLSRILKDMEFNVDRLLSLEDLVADFRNNDLREI